MSALAVQRVVSEPLAVNCYVVAVGGDAVVVDPGGDAAAIADLVAASGLRVHAVVATHGHYDHVGAAGDLTARFGVPFALHAADLASLRRTNFCRQVFHGLDRVAIPDLGIDLDGVARLAFGELELTVLHTPGHSPGSVCLEVGGELLAGDTFVAGEVSQRDVPGSNLEALDASVRRLVERYPPDTAVHPGHGPTSMLGSLAAAAKEPA